MIRLRTSEMLGRMLPPVNWEDTGTQSTAGGRSYLAPDCVEALTMDPVTGGPWKESVMELQDNPDPAKPWAEPFRGGLGSSMVAEAGVASKMSVVLDFLSDAVNAVSEALHLPQVHGWIQETTCTVIQKAVARLDPEKQSLVAGLQTVYAASSTSSRRQDVVFMVKAQQQQQPHGANSQSGLWIGEPAAIAEYKQPPALGTRVGNNQFDPVDLKQGFKDRDAFVLHAVCQVFTYLLLLGLQYGFISCYYWTWVVYLGKDRRTLYVSEPIAHDTINTPEHRAVTAMGAIYWVQRRGLDTRHNKDFDKINWNELKTAGGLRDELLLIPDSQLTASLPPEDKNDDEGDGGSKGGSGKGSGSEGSGSEGGSSKGGSGKGGSGKGGRGKGGSGNGGVSKRTKRPQQSAGALECRSQLGMLLCEGCSGLVLRGTYKGRSAVYKLFGPDRQGIAAGVNEATTYGALQQCQGRELATFLDWGHLALGVHYLATADIEGIPCSELPSELREAAAAAAETALQGICAVQPGFLHGDLRLPNIMIKHSSDDTAAPTAVIIDLAASQLNGTPAQVKAQFQQLKSMFRRSGEWSKGSTMAATTVVAGASGQEPAASDTQG